jgi:probable rRNA maturation factor
VTRRSQSSPAADSVPPREIAIANRHPRLRVDRRAVRRVIELLDTHAAAIVGRAGSAPQGELSVVFLTDAALAQLHAEFLDDPTTTDVITFEGDAQLGSAGEICVSADTAATYARALHLAGHDDLQPAKKRAMRRAEARALRLIERAGAIPSFALRRQSR